MSKKANLGQFYTTKYEHILQGMVIPEGVRRIVEPFAGNGDLLNFVDKNKYEVASYDIDPKQEWITQRDTLLKPPCYDDSFVLTNPPYLARNKNADKAMYDLYKCNDLYKCFLVQLVDTSCTGGIIIIPLNFMCSVRKSDIALRQRFFTRFAVGLINVFEEKVFDDTAYSVCSLQFASRTADSPQAMQAHIHPSNKKMHLTLNKGNGFTIGGEIYRLPQSEYAVSRATKLTDVGSISNILLKCIDDNAASTIKLRVVSDPDRFIDNTAKLSARSYATLVFTPAIDAERQLRLVGQFNKFLDSHRREYNSMFLTNYRESNSIARKRISFNLAFQICSHLLLA